MQQSEMLLSHVSMHDSAVGWQGLSSQEVQATIAGLVSYAVLPWLHTN
jgi:hypothetical protein